MVAIFLGCLANTLSITAGAMAGFLATVVLYIGTDTALITGATNATAAAVRATSLLLPIPAAFCWILTAYSAGTTARPPAAAATDDD